MYTGGAVIIYQAATIMLRCKVHVGHMICYQLTLEFSVRGHDTSASTARRDS
jgi:hypothetical protein